MTDAGRLAEQARAIAEAGIAETETEAEYYVRDLNAAGYSIVRTATLEAELLGETPALVEDVRWGNLRKQPIGAESVIGPQETP